MRWWSVIQPKNNNPLHNGSVGTAIKIAKPKAIRRLDLDGQKQKKIVLSARWVCFHSLKEICEEDTLLHLIQGKSNLKKNRVHNATQIERA